MTNRNRFFAYPYMIWISIMIIVPVFLVVYYSIIQSNAGELTTDFTLDHYKAFFTDTYLKILYKSLKLALITTIITLVFGYPTAYIISKLPTNKQNTTLLLFILPMWINMLLRTYAWQSILSRNGFLNTVLEFIGFSPLDLLYTDTAVIIGMIYNFIPFMVLPIYTAIVKVDHHLIEAAKDLGANKVQIFLKVTLPLTVPGIVTGIIMVFLPAISTFTIPRLLGGGQYVLIGNLIERQFLTIGNWNFGSSISMIVMFMILVSIYVMRFVDKDNASGKGGALPW